MKVNEAPEKLYLSKNIYSTYLYQVPDPDDDTTVEYTRADAFIEKAKQWLRCNNDLIDGDVADYVESFENYMKGE